MRCVKETMDAAWHSTARNEIKHERMFTENTWFPTEPTEAEIQERMALMGSELRADVLP